MVRANAVPDAQENLQMTVLTATPAYTALSQRMTTVMDGAFDAIAQGQRLTELTLEREAGETTPEADALYSTLLDRLVANGIQARWTSNAPHAGITVAFGTGLHR